MLQDGVASLPYLLRGYERHGGLGLHWQVGPSGSDGGIACPLDSVLGGMGNWSGAIQVAFVPQAASIAAPHCPCPVQLFTFDRHVERPAGGLLASYTACCGREAHAAHRHIKSFVQPRYTLGPQTVHSFNYHNGRHAVNTGGTRLVGPMLKPGQQVCCALGARWSLGCARHGAACASLRCQHGAWSVLLPHARCAAACC